MTSRVLLQRERIIQLALAIGDQEGLEAVSFRRLAAELGVTPMALYRHVRDKNDLLSGMADALLEALDLTVAPDAGWSDQLRQLIRAWRHLVIAHPVAPAVLPAATPLPMMRVTEVSLALLARAGFAPAEATAIVQQLSRFVVALAVIDHDGSFQLAAQDRENSDFRVRAALAGQPPREFPHLMAAMPHVKAWDGPNRDWEFGMELLVAGVEALLAKKQAATNHDADR